MEHHHLHHPVGDVWSFWVILGERWNEAIPRLVLDIQTLEGMRLWFEKWEGGHLTLLVEFCFGWSLTTWNQWWFSKSQDIQTPHRFDSHNYAGSREDQRLYHENSCISAYHVLIHWAHSISLQGHSDSCSCHTLKLQNGIPTIEFFCRTLWILKGIGDGDCVSAIAQQAQLASTWSAFALWCSGGDRVVTWGTWAKIEAKRLRGWMRCILYFPLVGVTLSIRKFIVSGCHLLQNWNEKTSGQNSKKSTRLKRKANPLPAKKVWEEALKKSQTIFVYQSLCGGWMPCTLQSHRGILWWEILTSVMPAMPMNCNFLAAILMPN